MGNGDSRCPRCGSGVPPDARFCASCGYATTRLFPGQTLDGKYEILDKLAEGGMGEVYRARHVHLDEIRIIKVTKPDPVGEGPEPRRFQEEARIATLIRHPNVAALYDFSRLPDGSFYMVWEFIDGVTLEAWLRRHGAMPAGRALEVARQVLSGLAEIHAQGIVHRDLAADNIMLRELPGGRFQAKIIDLGIAKRVASESLAMTGTGMFVGKLKYCSPEQAGALPRGETLDGRSDLYSFGVVLYEMLTGRPPFEAETPEGYLGQHLHTAPPPLDTSTLPAEIGPPLAAILKRALEKNRNRRFRDAEEFRLALERLGPVASVGAEGASTAVLRRRRALSSVAAVAMLLVLAAAVAAYLVIRRPARLQAAAPAEASAAAPTPAPTASPAVESAEVSAPQALESPPPAPRASSRSVADPSELGVGRPPAAAVTEPASEENAGASAEIPARMDAEAAQRFRQFLKRWSTLPVERQAVQSGYLARVANQFVATYPDDPLAGELRQTLPARLRDLALRELDGRRPRLAERFYEAYRLLAFAPRDSELAQRFAVLPAPQRARRPND
ncbi:MAG: protein kinase domain-containing protein [Acidobacteriota bacterium]